MGELEIYIKDYIVEERTNDPILNGYILLVRLQQLTKAPIFDTGLLDRPALWERKIRPWINEGFQELQQISDLAKPPV